MSGAASVYGANKCMIWWVHSEAMVVDGMTKWSSAVSRETTMSVARQYTWRIVQDSKLAAAKKRGKLHHLTGDEEHGPNTKLRTDMERRG